jgi:hypothetical protein
MKINFNIRFILDVLKKALLGKVNESHILIDDDSGKILISSEYIPVYI